MPWYELVVIKMYKRRDWLLTRGADGGGEETSTSSEGTLRYLLGWFYFVY